MSELTLWSDHNTYECELDSVAYNLGEDIQCLKEEITRLRAELAEVEGQEPVAWLIEECDSAQWLSFDKRCKYAQPLYTHPAPAKVPEGYALVPIEPTEAMMDAAAEVFFNLESSQWDDVLLGAYEAMLEAQGGE